MKKTNHKNHKSEHMRMEGSLYGADPGWICQTCLAERNYKKGDVYPYQTREYYYKLTPLEKWCYDEGKEQGKKIRTGEIKELLGIS